MTAKNEMLVAKAGTLRVAPLRYATREPLGHPSRSRALSAVRVKSLGSTPAEQQHDPTHPEEFSTRLIDWSPFVVMGNTMPPRDPDADEHEDRADEPPVVREPDED